MYYKWEFVLKEGSSVFAMFTDEEMRQKEKDHPEVKFNWS